MGNFSSGLSALGRAAPEINRINAEFEDIPRRRALFGQQMQINEMNINKLRAEENERVEREKFLRSGWDATVEPALAWLPDERKKAYLDMMKKNGLINEQGIGTQRSKVMAVQAIAQNAQLFQAMGADRINWSKSQIEQVNSELETLREKPNAKPEDIQRLEKQLETLTKNHHIMAGNIDVAHKSILIGNEIKKLQRSGEWANIPNALKIGMSMAYQTGNDGEFNRLLEKYKEVVPKEPTNEAQILALPDNDPRRISYLKGKKSLAREIPETRSEFDKKWMLATEIAKEKKGGVSPSKQEIASSFKSNFGSSDFLTALLTGGLQPSESGYVFEPGKGLIPKTK